MGTSARLNKVGRVQQVREKDDGSRDLFIVSDDHPDVVKVWCGSRAQGAELVTEGARVSVALNASALLSKKGEAFLNLAASVVTVLEPAAPLSAAVAEGILDLLKE